MPRGIKNKKFIMINSNDEEKNKRHKEAVDYEKENYSKPKETEVYESMKGINWRTKLKIVSEVIDNYERAHELGQYAPKQLDTQAPYKKPSYPTIEETNSHIEAVEGELTAGLYMTSKEGVRQDFELALHHIRIARRYFRKAFTV